MGGVKLGSFLAVSLVLMTLTAAHDELHGNRKKSTSGDSTPSNGVGTDYQPGSLLANILKYARDENRVEKRTLLDPLSTDYINTVIRTLGSRLATVNASFATLRRESEVLAQDTAARLLGEHFVKLNDDLQQVKDVADFMTLDLWTLLSKLIWAGVGSGWRRCSQFDQAVKNYDLEADDSGDVARGLSASLLADLSCMHGKVTLFKNAVFNTTSTVDLADEDLVQNVAIIVMDVCRIFWVEQNITRAVYNLARQLRQRESEIQSSDSSDDTTRELLASLRQSRTRPKSTQPLRKESGEMPVSSTTRRKVIRKRNSNVNNEPLRSPAMATMMADLKRQAFNLKDSVAARKCAAGKLAEDASYGELQDHIYEFEGDFRYTGYWLVSLLGQVCQTLDRIIEKGFKKKPSECISFSSYVNIITEDEGDQFNAQSLVTKLLSDVTCLQTRQEQLKKIVDITAENIGDAVMDFVLVKHVSLAVLHATRLKRDLQVMTSAVDQILGPIREAAVKQPEIPSRDETAKEGAGNGMGPRRDDFKRKLEKSMEENILRNELIRLLRLNEN